MDTKNIANMNENIDNKEFIDIINKLSEEGSEENECIFIEEIKKTRFLTPVEINDDDTLSFKSLKDNEGSSFIIAFTDKQQLEMWSKEKCVTLTMKYKDLKNAVYQNWDIINGFVINPYGHNLIIDKNSIEYISSKNNGDEN